MSLFIDDINSGSAALSPSRTLLAVTNLQDGIDFYSLRKKAYVTTTKYQIEARIVLKIVGIDFLDDNTVIAGHSAGHIILTSPGRLSDPDQVLITEELGGQFSSFVIISVVNKSSSYSDLGTAPSQLDFIYFNWANFEFRPLAWSVGS